MMRMSWIGATVVLALAVGLAVSAASCSGPPATEPGPVAKQAQPAEGRQVIQPKAEPEPVTPAAVEEPKPLIVADAESGKTIDVEPERLIQIRLEGNPADGLVWTLKEIKGEAVRLYGEPGRERLKVTRPNGPPFAFTFPLEAHKAGESVVTLTCHPASTDEPVKKTFTVTFEVKAPPLVPTEEAMKAIQSDLTKCLLTLQYHGDSTAIKVRRLVIHGPSAEVRVIYKSTKQGQPKVPAEWFRQAEAPLDEMASILGFLESDGFLMRASTDASIAPAGPQGYWLIVEGSSAASLREDLG